MMVQVTGGLVRVAHRLFLGVKRETCCRFVCRYCELEVLQDLNPWAVAF
jgi:hypothetical protein